MLEILAVSLVVLAAAGFFTRRFVRAVRRAPEATCGPACDGCQVASRCSDHRRPGLPVLAVLAVLLAPGIARAADTVETWDPGAVDVDFYLGYDGAGSPSRSVYGDIMVGYGIVEGFSAYLGTALTAPDSLAGGEPGLYLGVFGTLVDTDHVDFDLFLDLGATGDGMSDLEVRPSLELNLDAAPDLRSFGTYVRAGVVAHSADDASRAVLDVTLNPGAYVTLAGSHQLFVEYDMAFAPSDGATEIGGFALGYNVVINDALELVTQVHADIPQADEVAAVSFMAGFIATIDGPAGVPARSLLAAAE